MKAYWYGSLIVTHICYRGRKSLVRFQHGGEAWVKTRDLERVGGGCGSTVHR